MALLWFCIASFFIFPRSRALVRCSSFVVARSWILAGSSRARRSERQMRNSIYAKNLGEKGGGKLLRQNGIDSFLDIVVNRFHRL